MFIVWGKKIVYRKVGHVADFCPICRKVQPFELKRVGSAGHVYYVSVGEGELVGYERTCKECGTVFRAEPTTYASVSKTLAPLADLVRQTYPNIEHIIVDGGSTDGTLNVLRGAGQERQVRWLSEPDRGMYEAIRKGLALASGEVLAYLNSDDVYPPWAIEVAVVPARVEVVAVPCAVART